MTGQIITFYSYKGGTGRSMAVANVGWILASNGYRVLVVDWDLESPGLHRYLRPFLHDPELTSTSGLIDFLSTAMQPGGVTNKKSAFTEQFTTKLDVTPGGAGSIFLLPAGLQDKNYAQRLNSVDWNRFFENEEGRRLVEDMREAFRSSYDYVLIDSPAGAGDAFSICTVRMPDRVVIPFTLNHQSISGSKATAKQIRAMRGDKFAIFPVPTRVEYGETDKLQDAMSYTRGAFEEFLAHVQADPRVADAAQQMAYWADVETPYISFYAFQEILAVLKDDPGSSRGLLGSYERLASRISDGAVNSLYPEKKERRRALLGAYAFEIDDLRGPISTRSKPITESDLSRLIGRWITIRGWMRSRRYQLAAGAGLGAAAFIGLLSYFLISVANSQSAKIRSRLQYLPAAVGDRLYTSRDIPKALLPEITRTISELIDEVVIGLPSQRLPSPRGKDPSEQAPQAPQR